MPILDVEMVLMPDEILPANLANHIADDVGLLWDAPPGRIWVKLRTLAPDRYAENDVPEETFYPIFVSLLKAKWPPNEEMQREVTGLTDTIARCCRREAENVHICYLPQAAGRTAFGGRLVPGA